jgi:putative transposase
MNRPIGTAATLAESERKEMAVQALARSGPVQRLLSIHDQVANVFIRRPNQDTAAKFHIARGHAFTTWTEVTGVSMAA